MLKIKQTKGKIMTHFFNIWLKFFFLLTPFFVLSIFISMTADLDNHRRHRMAISLTMAIIVICMILFFLGNAIFSVFGITLDAFRIGAGSLLFLSAVDLIRGNKASPEGDAGGNIIVVPLAIPIAVGPATTGALLIMGAELQNHFDTFTGCAGLVAAILSLGVLLFVSAGINKIIGDTGLKILSKLTGLILSALAAQIVFTGIANFLKI